MPTLIFDNIGGLTLNVISVTTSTLLQTMTGTELHVDVISDEIVARACVAYMDIWSDDDVKETIGPEIKPLVFSRYHDFLVDREVALVDAIYAACATPEIALHVFTRITRAANYLGMPYMTRKMAAIVALTIMSINTPADVLKNTSVVLPTTFDMTIRNTVEDILAQSPELADTINS